MYIYIFFLFIQIKIFYIYIIIFKNSNTEYFINYSTKNLYIKIWILDVFKLIFNFYYNI